MEKKLESVLRDFEYHAREAVNAIQDRAAAQRLSKDAERRISKVRREFREQFDSTIVAHTTGADKDDPQARPQEVKHVGEGDTVKLKSVGRPARIMRRIDDNHFEVEIGAMKMKIARDDIAEVVVRAGDSPVTAARARGFSVSLEKESANAASEINVIGRTVDDATGAVEVVDHPIRGGDGVRYFLGLVWRQVEHLDSSTRDLDRMIVPVLIPLFQRHSGASHFFGINPFHL